MQDKKMYILLVISILFAVVGVSLAFFSLNIIGNDKVKDTKITTGDLELVFTDDNEVSLDGAFPGDSITKTISVKNTGTKEVSYNIVWQELLNEITNNELVIDGTCKNLNSSNTEDGECSAISKKAVKEGNITSNIPIKPGYTQEYIIKITFIDTGKLQNYNKNKSFKGKLGLTESSAKTVYCTYDGELTQGAEYVNGQYTYRYMQRGSKDYDDDGNPVYVWKKMTDDGWGVQLTDKASTSAVTSELCTYINNRPIISMQYVYGDSHASSIDIKDFNTSNVIDMSYMFSDSSATIIDTSGFNTSNVISMSYMFSNSVATAIGVSDFDTSNVINMSYMFSNTVATAIDVSNFDTSNVTNMNGMFLNTNVVQLDISNFNTSNVTDMGLMFQDSKLNVLDLSSFNTSNVTSMAFMFMSSTNLEKIYVSDKFDTENVRLYVDMFRNCIKLVGGAGTTYDSTKTDKAYARIDKGTNSPGYFTDIADKPVEPYSFSSDSWATIANAVKNNNISKYNVGDTKTVNLGTYGSHMVRIANTSTPSECSGTGFSQSACGFVVEFTDIVAEHVMKDTADNTGGWPGSSMYTFVNTDLYNSLPYILKNTIIDTTVVSGHGDTSGEENFTSTDKLYLLAPKEIYTNFSSRYDTAKDLTRTLDYYTNIGVTTSNYSGAIKKNGTSTYMWWLREANSSSSYSFHYVTSGGRYGSTDANNTYGVAPAFRLG